MSERAKARTCFGKSVSDRDLPYQQCKDLAAERILKNNLRGSQTIFYSSSGLIITLESIVTAGPANELLLTWPRPLAIREHPELLGNCSLS